MKTKIYPLFLTAFALIHGVLNSVAATVTVTVQSSTFAPADFTVNQGDTVVWTWGNNAGNHTTTSTTIPAGALAWDEQINHNATTFAYVPAIAGSYNYICSFHFSMGMVGHFTVNGTSGIAGNLSSPGISLHAVSANGQRVIVKYEIPNAAAVDIKLLDMLGNEVKVLMSGSRQGGLNTEEFEVPGVQEGIYFILLETSMSREIRRVFVQ